MTSNNNNLKNKQHASNYQSKIPSKKTSISGKSVQNKLVSNIPNISNNHH